MGAFTYLDPSVVKPMPGKVVVEIVEILGGMTKGGVFVPGTLMDHMGKDTFYGKILSVGDAPRLSHYKSGPGPGWDVQPSASGKQWPAEIMDTFQVGDILVLPRDVPLTFTWESRRFGIVLLHEALLHIPGESFDPQAFEVVPWTPGEIEGDNIDVINLGQKVEP